MSRDEKKQNFLTVITLLFLLFLAHLMFRLVIKNAKQSGASLSNPGPILFPILIFVLFLLLIGFIIWNLFGEQISAPFASFLLQSGGKITKPKYYSKARALVMRNKIGEAIKIYEEILNEDKADITVYYELADIYHEKLKDYPAAFNCYEKIEEYAREDTDIIFAINRKADIYMSNKDYPKAIEELGKIIQKFPKLKDARRAEERIESLKQFIKE